jgi:hypothetical protein
MLKKSNVIFKNILNLMFLINTKSASTWQNLSNILFSNCIRYFKLHLLKNQINKILIEVWKIYIPIIIFK